MLEHRQPSCIEAPTMPSTIKTVPFQPPKKQQRQKEDAPWHQYLTIDLIWYVLGYTFFHPFVSWIVVLCLRAQYTKYEAPEMRIAIAWSMAMSIIGIFGVFSDRIAFGPHREVELSEEVIVITGGVDGLGGLLADTYGMRNAMVAVLDVKGVDKAEAEAKGVSYYRCDVGDAQQVEAAAAQIVKDVSPYVVGDDNPKLLTYAARPSHNPDQQRRHRPHKVDPRLHRRRSRANLPRQYHLPLHHASHVPPPHDFGKARHHRHRLLRPRPPGCRKPLRIQRFESCTSRSAPFAAR